MNQDFKKFLQYLFLLALFGISGYFIYQSSLSPCQKPLYYKIGRFDTQFGVSKEDFKSHIANAGKVWEKALGRKIFIYDSNADFSVNLIYDERQLATTQKQKTEFGLSAVEDVFKKIDTEFSIFKNNYEKETSSYEQDLAVFNQRKSVYDETVAFWNKKGEVSKDKYDELEAERVYLNEKAQELNTRAISINEMTKQLNALLNERNAKAAEYNKIAENYNKKYGGGLEFNQAEYVGNPNSENRGVINVYQFGNKNDLTLALTHELGHAIGMNHVENPKSIMYYLTGINAQNSLTSSAEDLAELNKVCKIK